MPIHVLGDDDIVIRSAYSPKEVVSLEFHDPSLTKQASLEEVDINAIMERYTRTGIIEHQKQYQGTYDDFTNVQDYQTSLNQVIAAQEMFMSLPAQLRARFENDPANFLQFATDPANKDEMGKLGLLKQDEVKVLHEDVFKDKPVVESPVGDLEA